MRIIFLFIFLSIAVYGEDWKTADGKIYQGVTVVKVEADAVTILDEDGGARIDLARLPADLQRRFNYDPAKAKVAADKRAQDDAASAQALEEETEAAQDKRQSEYEYEEGQRQQQAQQNAYTAASQGGSAPVAVPYPSEPTAEELELAKEQKIADAIKKQDEKNGYSHASGRVSQVLSNGFIGYLGTRWGTYETAFVECDSSNMVDDQSWAGIVVPAPTYHYVTALGAEATVPGFSTNLKKTALIAPNSTGTTFAPRPVSSLTAVGGG